MAMMKIIFHLATYSMKSSKNQESKVNILQIDGLIDYFLSYHLFVNAKKLILNYSDAQPLRYPSQVFGVETLVATSKVINEKGLKLLEGKIPIEYVGGYVSDSENGESEQEKEDEEKVPDFENYEEAVEANNGMLEFSDDEEKIEENDGMISIENTENTFEWEEAIACIS